jgi:integrase/recombinase XerC
MIPLISQAQSHSALDHLIHQTGIQGELEMFLLSCKVEELSLRTIKDYQDKIGKMIRFCQAQGVKQSGEVTANHIRMFLLSLQERCNRNSIRDYYRNSKRFFNWLIEQQILTVNPMSLIRPPREEKKVIQPFTQDNISLLLEACDLSSPFLAARNKAIILTFVDSGLRLSEMASVQIADLNIEQKTIKVLGKGSKERFVGIGKATQKAILKYLMLRHDELPGLWVTEERQPMTWVGIQIMIRRLRDSAGLTGKRRSPHTFRHTFATQALLNGASEREVQMLLGHSTVTMTQRYQRTITAEYAIQGYKKFSPVDRMVLFDK